MSLVQLFSNKADFFPLSAVNLENSTAGCERGGGEELEDASAQNPGNCALFKGAHVAAFIFPSSSPGR